MSKITFTKTTTTATSETHANITTTEVCVYNNPFEDYERLIARTVVTRAELFPQFKDCFKPENIVKTQDASSSYPFAVTVGYLYLGDGIQIETYRGVYKEIDK